MPGLNLFTSNRLEKLAELLAGTLETPLSSPLKQEVILIQSRGMQRWITLKLAEHFGSWSCSEFPFPNSFVSGLFSTVMPDVTESPLFQRDVMVWRIRSVLSGLKDRSEFAPLKSYLKGGREELKRFQLAARIADLFDQYLVYRPDMIHDWEEGKESHWQAILWRELAGSSSFGDGTCHRAELRRRFLGLLADEPLGSERLPERLSVFAPSSLPPFHTEILVRLGVTIPVNFYLMNPCREFWFDLAADRVMARRTVRDEVFFTEESLHLERGNRLLASLGGLGADFYTMLQDLEVETKDEFVDTVPVPPDNRWNASLLQYLQSDILDLRNSGSFREVHPKDESVQIHSCHSPLREVEVLHDQILKMLSDDPGLLPEDILVMAPEIDDYAPFVPAVFSGSGKTELPYNLTDRSALKEGSLIRAFLSVFDLHGERFGVLKVLELLESFPVRRHLGLTQADNDLIREWITDTRITWGRDADDHVLWDLPASPERTWRHGLDRLLLGFALPEEVMYGKTLPYSRMEGRESSSLLGQLVDWIERLFSLCREMESPMGLAEWADLLTRLLSDFFSVDADTERENDVILRAVNHLAGCGIDTINRESVPLDVISSYLADYLSMESLGSGFLSRGITFCSMLPMRSVPFRVICLLGMNDTAFPRIARPLAFDLMAEKPLPGDRSRRKDDRYLFLETLLSARSTLYISYIGQSVQSVSESRSVPPSVLVSELLDYLDDNYRLPEGSLRDSMVRIHRLHGFHPEYFQTAEKEPRLMSYSEENFNASRALYDDPIGRSPFFTEELPPPDETYREIELDELCRFYGNPARYLLSRRLGLKLDSQADRPRVDAPLQLDGLESYRLGSKLLEWRREGKSSGEYYQIARAEGILPPGGLGLAEFNRIAEGVGTFLNEYGQLLSEETFREGECEIGNFHIRGRIRCVGTSVFLYRYGYSGPNDWIRLWLYHLFTDAAEGADWPSSSLFAGRDGTLSFPGPPEGRSFLEKWLEAYWRGLAMPLPFFPKSSFAYAETRYRGKSEAEALKRAAGIWNGSSYQEGEGGDPYFVQCFRDNNPLKSPFREWADALLSPLFLHAGGKKP